MLLSEVAIFQLRRHRRSGLFYVNDVCRAGAGRCPGSAVLRFVVKVFKLNATNRGDRSPPPRLLSVSARVPPLAPAAA
ncbi:hypothetical protein D3C72_1950800 [compost metagenome]